MINDHDRTVRVLTANLYAHHIDLGGLRELLEGSDPDVALVQELSGPAAEVLSERFSNGLLHPAKHHGGMGLALRRPAPVERLPLPYRDGQIGRLGPPEWPGPLEVINVHMANPVAWPPQRTVRRRRRQLGALMATVDPPRARIVAGDFNASPAWGVYRRLAGRFGDAARVVAAAQGRRPARTWGPTPRSPRMLRIDHVFTEQVRPIDVQVVKIPGSDHCGLLVDLKLGETFP